ncbi:MAG: ABC transporter permease [Nocardioidaceae bacterium]
MTDLTFSPAPGARSWPAASFAYARIETRLVLRNAEQLVLALVIPLLVLVGGTEADGVIDLGVGRPIDVLTPGVMALAVVSTSFNSLAIATGFERRYGVLKRLGATPLPRSGLLAGKALSVLAIETGQLALIAVVGVALGWQPTGGLGAVVGAVVLVLLGTGAFAGLALLMAGSLRAEATLAAANLVFVLLVVGGAVVVPLSSYPGIAADLAALLPSGALAEGLREVTTGGAPGWERVAVLLGWGVGAGLLTARTFRWE